MRRAIAALLIIAVATASVPLLSLRPSRALAADGEKITFENGNSVTLHADGTITGKAQLTGGWLDEDRMGHHDKMVMPDGAKLPAGCYEKYIQQPNHAEYGVPADGTYPFTATPKKQGGYFVLMHSETSKYIVGYTGVWPGKVQQSYTERWEPKINVEVTFEKASSDATLTASNDRYRVEGAEYRIVRIRDGREVARIKTNAQGIATCKLEPNTAYQAIEVKAPQGFLANPEPVKFTTTTRATTVQLKDKPVRARVTIRKHDSATGGAAQAGASLKGAVYKLVDARGIAQTATTDAEGRAAFKEPIPLGTATVSEVTPPVGYKPDSRVHTIEVTQDGQVADGTIELEVADGFSEDIIAFDLEIAKHKQDPNADEGGLNIPAEGVSFDIISNTTGKAIGSITTDRDGFAKTPDDAWFGAGTRPEGVRGSIPYDAKGYTVRERPETVPEGYEQMRDFIISADEMADGVILKYIVENVSAASRLQIVKVDAQSGQPIALPGFSFQLLDENNEPVTQEVWYPNHVELNEFTTDESGSVTLPGRLAPGTYHLKETKAVAPYLLNGEILEVAIGADGQGIAIATFADERALGAATIVKSDVESGSPLAGAVYDVRAVEEIAGPDGSVYAQAGEHVARITTGEDGTATAKELPLGLGTARYEFVEVEAPDGYVLDPTPLPFELSYADQETAVVTTRVEAVNQPSELIVEKTDASSGKPLEGVVFELTRAKDADDGEGEGIAKESPDHAGIKDERKTTDDKGRARWTHLERGTYELRELEAPRGYVIDRHPRTVVVGDDGSAQADDMKDGVIRITNDTTKVEIVKLDADTEQPVSGAHLAIHDKQGNVIARWVSTDDPHRVTTLAPGSYTLVEEQTPSTHDIAEPVPFTVEETTELIRVVMHDKPLNITAEVDKRQETINQGRLAKQTGGIAFDYEIAARNTSGTWVDEFTVTDGLTCVTDGMARLIGLTTPCARGDRDGFMNVWYQTNASEREGGLTGEANATLDDGHENPWLNDEHRSDAIGSDGRGCPYEGWRLWKQDVPADKAVDLSVQDLGLPEDEHVVAVRFEYGCVDESFTTREGLWDRPDIKHEGDAIDRQRDPKGKLAPAMLHMRTTELFEPEKTLRNSAFVDAYRNGGGDGLEDHDQDNVEQSPERPIVPQIPTLDQTGADPLIITRAFAIATAGTACVLVALHGARAMKSVLDRIKAKRLGHARETGLRR